MIQARGVGVRSRAGRALIEDVSLALQPGQVTAVLGPNGAGKTTLLRVLAGELAAGSGQVTWDGVAIGQFGRLPLARRRAVLGQHQTLDFALPVGDVVALGRLPHAGTAAMRHDRAAIAAVRERFALGGFWHRAYPTLSGGERQRTQLARVAAQLWRPADAAANGTHALFLDEPTAALDLAQQGHALDYARAMAAAGMAVLAVLHDLNQAARADRVVLLRAGHLLAEGPAAETLTRSGIEATFGVAVQEVARPGGGVGFLVL